ncbi:MAG: putative drug exporter of the superfamily [Solirubrobacterales bacterium]|jgi:RND superfamily putative drug exporter|nr:putative drug exporter of the superfamily [Solirubrobacterales bacterium]
MRDSMNKLAALLGRRRRWVVAAWVLIVVLALPFAAKQTDHLTGGGFDVPGSQSKAVSDSLQESFGSRADGISVVLEAAPDATPAERAAAVGRVRHEVATLGGVTLAPAAALKGRAQLQRTGITVLPLRSDRSSDQLIDSAGDLRTDLDPGSAAGGVTPYLVGQPTIWAGMQEISKKDLSKAESSGFPIVAIILLIVFGSLAAAALPLALGFVSVLVTGALIYFISLQMTTSVFVTNMASMIGIGVAIDYSLFILARYREEREAGHSKDEARARSLSTSGLAVTFSGLAVIISLAGLWMVDNQALRSMALGAMTVVAVSILTATTLLPALIAMLGDRVLPGGIVGRVERFFGRRFYRRRKPRPADAELTPGASPFWTKWTARVMAHPWTAIIGVSAVLLLLASPLLSLQTGTEALAQFPKGSDVRVGNELASAQLGGGTDPIQIVASFGGPPRAADRAAVAGFVRQLDGTAGVSSVAPPAFAPDAVLIQATPSAGSESEAATALVDRLRDNVVPATALGQVATVDVGGETARSHDVRDQISGSMWKIVLFVLALSFVVLMVMLRSLLLPLKAVVMNLLSIGAAFGVLVAIFQWGWFDGFLGFESQGALDTINVPLIFAVVFGLSMDYEVFLMSRIRERYMRHGDNERAVAEGLSSSARTISSAALIMASVFAVFVLTGVPSIKELGLGCAVAIALDATLVRLILVPAAMKLMGRWNWWMPAWLDRALPDLSFESRGEPEPTKA